MNEVFAGSVFFGVCLTLAGYQLGCFMQKRWKLALCNPLLIATVVIIGTLLMFDIDYETYEAGGSYISFFLTPVTVCLAVPLYRQMKILKENFAAIAAGIASGCAAHVLVVTGLAVLFKLDSSLFFSLMPKSITTPIAVGIASEIGGLEVITIAAVLVAGILGAVTGPWIWKVFKIEEPAAQGLSIGTASHAVGTSKAMEAGELQGAMSSLAIVVNGILTVIVIPLIVSVIHFK